MWSWRLARGVELAGGSNPLTAGDGGKRSPLTGESAKEAVKTIAQGRPVAPPGPVVAYARTFLLRARLRVQCAPGFPAPSHFGGMQNEM